MAISWRPQARGYKPEAENQKKKPGLQETLEPSSFLGESRLCIPQLPGDFSYSQPNVAGGLLVQSM